MAVRATAIVRARDEAGAIERALRSLREQTVRPEIVVVDSGSTDGTLEIARRLADRVVEMDPATFTYGRALNVGARAASAPFHFALSAHCVAHRTDWVERSLAHYAEPHVAGVCGIAYAGGRRLAEPLVLRGVAPGGERGWGFSNHASSWRAEAWEAQPFDEALAYGEDRVWSWAVMDAGWAIVFDPNLRVEHAHQWRTAREAFRRERLAAEALAPFPQFPHYDLRRLAAAWWREVPVDGHPAAVHRFLNHKRLAGLAGRWVGYRAGARRAADGRPAVSASRAR